MVCSIIVITFISCVETTPGPLSTPPKYNIYGCAHIKIYAMTCQQHLISYFIHHQRPSITSIPPNIITFNDQPIVFATLSLNSRPCEFHCTLIKARSSPRPSISDIHHTQIWFPHPPWMRSLDSARDSNYQSTAYTPSLFQRNATLSTVVPRTPQY